VSPAAFEKLRRAHPGSITITFDSREEYLRRWCYMECLRTTLFHSADLVGYYVRKNSIYLVKNRWGDPGL
jgi:hypothetical protein